MLLNREVSGEKMRKGSLVVVASSEKQSILFTFVMFEILVLNDIPQLEIFTVRTTDVLSFALLLKISKSS